MIQTLKKDLSRRNSNTANCFNGETITSNGSQKTRFPGHLIKTVLNYSCDRKLMFTKFSDISSDKLNYVKLRYHVILGKSGDPFSRSSF